MAKKKAVSVEEPVVPTITAKALADINMVWDNKVYVLAPDNVCPLPVELFDHLVGIGKVVKEETNAI